MCYMKSWSLLLATGGSVLMLLLLSLFLLPVESITENSPSSASGVISDATWLTVRCNDSEHGPAVCACTKASRSEVSCDLVAGLQVPSGRLPCLDVNHKKLSSLSINCSDFSDCATLHLDHLVRRSSLLRLEFSGCQLDRADEVDPPGTTRFALINDGMAKITGSAWFISSQSNQSASNVDQFGCSLRRLRIKNSDLKLPIWLLQKCPRIYSIHIANSRLQDLTAMDIFTISAATDVELSGTELFYFGDDLRARALDGMNQQPLNLECNGKKCSNFTLRARAIIDSIIQASGAVNDVRILHYAMEMDNIDFRLILGKIEGALHVPSPLSKLDLSNNKLNLIPSCLSMMSNLQSLNLSGNRIEDLYDVSGCWGGPPSGIPLSANEKTKRHCYWFWSSRKSLRVLDLSHNLISYLGAVEPWYEVDLWTLDLSYNRITVMGADSFTGSLAFSLRYLNVDNNLLRTVNLTSLRKVIRFSAASNRISCIKNDTLPNSESLRCINFDNNSISSIAPNVFKHYPILWKVDLRKNMLEYMPAASFETSQRQAKSDRVEFSISEQNTPIVCDCQHFFAYTMLEEESDEHVYRMPSVTTRERESIKCRLAPRLIDDRYEVNKSLIFLHQNNFGCALHDYSNIELPKQICQRKSGHCIGKCNAKCFCWANNINTIMNCSISGIPLSAKNIPMPITTLDFSLVTTSFIQVLRNTTFTWQFDEDRRSLREIRAYQSGIVSISDYAFSMMPGVTKIFASYNRIKKLTQRTFAGLETTLNLLDLRHNNLSMIFPKRVFQPLLALGKVSLFGNPFKCSCSTIHLNYLKEMADYYGVKSVIQDYRELTCKLTSIFVKDFNYYNLSSVYTNFTLSSFPMDSVSLLETICAEIDDLKSQVKIKILQTTLITLGIAVGLIVLVILVRRRHYVQSIIIYSFLAHLMKPRRCRDAKSFHVFLYFDESDDEIASDILEQLKHPPTEVPVSGEIRVCHSSEHAPSEEQLTKTDSIPYFVERSVKVLVLLSNGLLQRKAKEVVMITNKLGNRRIARDLILIAVDRKNEIEMQLSSLQETIRSAQERKGMETWIRILTMRQTIPYGSRDWHYQLMNKILGDLPLLSSRNSYGSGLTITTDAANDNSNDDGELELNEHSHLLTAA